MDTIEGGRRREVVEFFRASQRPLTARDVADELGLHINTARFHLDALVRHGTLRREEGHSAGRGRPRTRYLLAPGMDRGGPRNYKLLSEMLLSHLASEDSAGSAAVRAGQAWGRYLVPPPAPSQRLSSEDGLARLTDLLSDVGFDPQLFAEADADLEIRLRNCPFLELAETHRELVCALHLGLMQGALEQLGIPLHARSLTPFADPHTCVAHLVPADTGPGATVSRLGDTVSIAAAFVWLGMVLAISFLEAPLKFRAPGITLPLGLGIGRLVFRALNASEAVLAVALVIGTGLGDSRAVRLPVAIALAAVLLVQVVGVRPGLDRRAQAIIAGGDRAPSRGHVTYIGLEIVKVALLITVGLVTVSGALR